MPKPIIKKGQMQRGLRPKRDNLEVKAEKGSLLDNVEEDLLKDGIKLFENENIMEEFLTLPLDLTEEPSKDLGRYFTTFTKQKMYVRTLLGRTGAMLRVLYEELEEIKDKVFSELPPKMSITEKNLKLRSHERFGERAVELLEKVAYLEQKRVMLSDYLDNLIDGIVCISREITRRENDWNDETRENSINNKRRR